MSLSRSDEVRGDRWYWRSLQDYQSAQQLCAFTNFGMRGYDSGSIWTTWVQVVDEAYQKMGIGKRLIDETRLRLEPEYMIVLLAAPNANEYYPKIGFEHNPRAWVLRGS